MADGIAKLAPWIARVSADPRLLLPHQDQLIDRTGGRDFHFSRFGPGDLRHAPPQINLESGAVSQLGINFDVPARLLHEAIDLTQSEPGTARQSFCGEERIEGTFGNFR